MTQATNGRLSLFSPFFQTGEARLSSAGQTAKLPVQDAMFAVSRERQSAAIITAGGQRFSIHQIGSMFGRE
jgi:ubiquitin